MATHLEDALEKAGLKLRRDAIQASPDWVLIDAGDLVVHLFRPEARATYALERMWGPDSPVGEAHAAERRGGAEDGGEGLSRPPPRLLAVGRMRPGGPEAALFAEYNKRLRPPLAVTEIAEAARAASPAGSAPARGRGPPRGAARRRAAGRARPRRRGPVQRGLRRAVDALGRERADTLLRGRRRRGARPGRAGRRRAPPVARAADLAAPAGARPAGGAALPRAVDPRRPSLPPRVAAVRGQAASRFRSESGVARKPTQRRFQPLMAATAKARLASSASLNCSRAAA